MTKSMKPKSLKRGLQVLPILSILSFLYYYYHPYLPSLLRSIDISSLGSYFETRKAMFLVCNFILIFLAKDSGLLGTPSAADRHHEEQSPKTIEVKASSTIVEGKAIVEVTSSKPTTTELAVEEEIEILSSEGVEDVDELNRRCEEFIEMVKRERKREALHV